MAAEQAQVLRQTINNGRLKKRILRSREEPTERPIDAT
jgi:hypothetical protein